MSQQNPSTPIYPLFMFLFETERFLLEALKSRDTVEPAVHEELKNAYQKFRKWGIENYKYLAEMADDLENSEVHKPKNYKGYQILFWKFRKMWPNVYLVKQVMKDRAKAKGGQETPTTAEGDSATTTSNASQQNPPKSEHPPPTSDTTANLFAKFKSPVMLPFAKWWAEAQDKKEGPLLPASSFEQAIEGICSSISLILEDWETDIAPDLMPEVEPRELSTGGEGHSG
ncbi:hypothetical protein B0H65DRAFT_582429 [Neurospora tetraspora]|uniref:Uncharacterized protein n=1 Tax=Neurospora tetraspora TaxID=94610 RepID=A0AAE0MNB5_9PEZI|nr:hypothetical protein B0H65DRAFT_582429 [Neurospora tetraspora]